MLGHKFHHQTIKKYVVLFGTLFNDIQIDRYASNGTTVLKTIDVPLSYSPKNKLLSLAQSNPDQKQGIILPRMGFEITSIDFASARALNKNNRVKYIGTTPQQNKFQYVPRPYDIGFQLSILVKNAEDGTSIVEQILPFFTPEFNVAANLIEGYDKPIDVPIRLDSTTLEDIYDGTYEERRALVWTLEFTLEGQIFGPISEGKIIREINLNLFDELMGEATTAVVNMNKKLGIVGANPQPDPSTVTVDDDYTDVTVTTNLDTIP